MFLFWIFISGELSFMFISIGFFSIILTLFMFVKYRFFKYSDGFSIFGLSVYIFQLLKAVVHSSFALMKKIFNEDAYFNAGICKINVCYLSINEKILFANIITMTPGTFVISVNGDEFLIHSINLEEMQSLNTEKIIKLVKSVKKTED